MTLMTPLEVYAEAIKIINSTCDPSKHWGEASFDRDGFTYHVAVEFSEDRKSSEITLFYFVKDGAPRGILTVPPGYVDANTKTVANKDSRWSDIITWELID